MASPRTSRVATGAPRCAGCAPTRAPDTTRSPTSTPARLDAAAAGPRLAAALAALTADDREALLLLAWGDLRYDEIAVALAIPVGTVRSRLHRARRVLRAHLEATP